MILTESVVEDATLDWFAEHGFTVAHGPDLAPLPQLLSGEVRITNYNMDERAGNVGH